MTFVRGVERDPASRADEDRSSRDRPGGRSFLRGDRTPPFKSLWQHLTTNKLYAVAMTRDKRFIIAGGQSGDVLFMDMAGRLLWTGRTAGVVNRIALAEDADSFITSTLQRGHKAYRWHYSGRLLHTYETEGSVWGIATTPDASLVVLGSEDKHLYAFDQHDELLFKRELDEPIRQVAVTADGALIFASSDDQHVYAFDRAGEQRWRFQTEGRVYAGVRVADEARVLVAGSNDGHVYGLDFEGNERWRFQTGDLVNALAITPDGQFCAAGGKSATAYLLDDQGEVLWSTQTEEAIYGLDLSPDGQYMVVGANDSAIYLFDYQRNRRVIKEKLNGRIYAVALSADAQYIAAASSDQKVYAYQYTEVDGDGQELTRPASKPHSRLVVGGVREEYARSSHAGLVGWFSEFEKSLRYQQFDICRALLDEAHEENSFNLSEGEMRFTRSLEGAYWLFRGIAHHRQEQYDEARACYEQSKTIQEALHNQDGVGQVIAVLSLLGEQEPAVDSAEDSMEAAAETVPEVAENTTEGEIAADTAGIEEVLEALEALETTPGSPRPRTTAFHRSQQAETRRLLDEILNKPRVLGMSEKLLEQRITEVPATEQHQIILLARQSGVIAPLVKALNAEDRVIRAEASAALTFLTPGPSYDVLGEMLASDQMFVRWQALRMLRARAYDNADEFKKARKQLWPVALSESCEAAPNPLTRREEALLVRDAGSVDDTPWLLTCLKDPDADVQVAAAWALGQIGDRRALIPLKQVPNKSGFLGSNLQGAARDAASSIEKRYPLPTVERIIFCQHNPLEPGQVQQSSLLLPDAEHAYGIVVLDHISPGAEVTVTWRQGDQVLKEELREISSESDPAFAAIIPTEIVGDAPRRRLGDAAFGERRPGQFGQRDEAQTSPYRSATSSTSSFRRRSNDDEDAPPQFGRARPASFGANNDESPSSSFRSRFAQPAEPERPPLARTRPSEQTDSPSSFRRPGQPEPRPGSSFRDRTAPSGRSPFGRRFIPDPIENVEPDPQEEDRFDTNPSDRPAADRRTAPLPSRSERFGQSSRRPSGDASPFRRSENAADNDSRPSFLRQRGSAPRRDTPARAEPVPSSRFGSSRTAARPASRPSASGSSSTSSFRSYLDRQRDQDRAPTDRPRSLFRDRDSDRAPADRSRSPFQRDRDQDRAPVDRPRSPFQRDRDQDRGPIERPRSLFRDRDSDRMPVPPQRAEPVSRPRLGRSLLAQFPRSARVMVFELPRPESGWDIATYQLEVTLDEGVKQHDSFKVIETIQLAGLEPGVPAPRGPEFYSSYVFMANTNYIDCMVHLHEAPVNTAVRGKLYSTTSGMLLGETVATTKKQGRQQVQLTWQNGGWRTGYYRLEVEVHPGNTLTTEIELIARITVQGINLCHQIAPDGGPVGTDWPFYPGDRCYCVAELGAPPPGVKLQATWYHKEHQLNTVSPPPYVTKAGTQQYAVFELAFKDKQETLTPGHYSVVVSGQDMIRAEQSFTVQPYPRRHQMMQTIDAARDRSMAFLKKYHLDRILPLLFLMLLFGLGFALADAGLNYTLDHDRESGNAILRISQALGQPRWEWAIGWFVGGIAYAVLQTRNERNLGGVFEDDAYKIIHYLLVFVSSALVWYTLSYLLFSVGYVWPTILLGFFDKVLWLNPLVAWFAPLVAFVISEWHRQDRNDNDVFFLAPVVAGISVVGVILVGWLAGLGCGLTLAIIGGIIGELLNVIGVDNGLGHGLMTIGSGIGFFAGLIGVGWYWGHEALQEFWKDWKSAKRVANDPSFSFLSYLIREDVLPFTEVEWRHIANITLRALGVLLITTIALLIAYRAVVVPVLTALYNMPAEAVIEGFVPPLLPALAVGLLIAWLVAFYDLYQHSLKPLLNAEQAGYVRRVALAMMTTVAVAFLAITIVSRTSVGTDLAPELAVFWTNRIAALVLVGAGVLCSIWLLAIMPDSVEDALNLDFDMGLSETMVLMAVALVVIFMPTWLWAGLVGLILLLIGGGLQLARRIA